MLTVFPRATEFPVQIPPRLQTRRTKRYETKVEEARKDRKGNMVQPTEF